MNLKIIRSFRKPDAAIVFLIIFLCKGLFFTDIAIGQAKNDVDPDISGITQNIAPVKVDGRVLFYVSGISSFPPQLRADTISNRINKAAADISISADSVTITKGEEHLKIFAGKKFIMNIYSTDCEAGKISMSMFASLVKLKTQAAINSYRLDRSRPVL